MFCGLRRTDGVTADHFRALTGLDLDAVYGEELASLATQGLVTWDGACVRLTTRGTLLANEVLVRLM
jgi:coproporphyrinogen III oxidase-like Fe-S oxidoreductase